MYCMSRDTYLVKFGRIKFHSSTDHSTYWCELSDEAWALVSAERKARALRMMTAQPVDKTCDKG